MYIPRVFDLYIREFSTCCTFSIHHNIRNFFHIRANLQYRCSLTQHSTKHRYNELNVQDEDMMTQYIYAFYWSVTTVTTVGYGDIGPANTYEMLYACASMVLAGCFYAYVVATISSYFLSTDEHVSQFNANMKRLKAYMKHREFPIALERQVKSYFAHFYRNQFASFDEMQMIRQLPQ